MRLFRSVAVTVFDRKTPFRPCILNIHVLFDARSGDCCKQGALRTDHSCKKCLCRDPESQLQDCTAINIGRMQIECFFLVDAHEFNRCLRMKTITDVILLLLVCLHGNLVSAFVFGSGCSLQPRKQPQEMQLGWYGLCSLTQP